MSGEAAGFALCPPIQGVAAAAVDVDFALAARDAQPLAAGGALEIFVFLPVLHTADKLADFGSPSGGERQILPVFRHTLLMIAREHPEKGPDIKRETEQGEKPDTGETADQGTGKAGKQRKHAEIIGTVTALHETGKRHFQTLEETHGNSSFLEIRGHCGEPESIKQESG